MGIIKITHIAISRENSSQLISSNIVATNKKNVLTKQISHKIIIQIILSIPEITNE